MGLNNIKITKKIIIYVILCNIIIKCNINSIIEVFDIIIKLNNNNNIKICII